MVKQFSVRVPRWAGVWLIIAALVAGAVFLWIGLALAIVFVVLGGFALLASWMRRLWTHKRAPPGPVTIEGHYTKTKQ